MGLGFRNSSGSNAAKARALGSLLSRAATTLRTREPMRPFLSERIARIRPRQAENSPRMMMSSMAAFQTFTKKSNMMDRLLLRGSYLFLSISPQIKVFDAILT